MGRKKRQTANQEGNVFKPVRLLLAMFSINVASLALLAGCESSVTREKAVAAMAKEESGTSDELKLLKAQLAKADLELRNREAELCSLMEKTEQLEAMLKKSQERSERLVSANKERMGRMTTYLENALIAVDANNLADAEEALRRMWAMVAPRERSAPPPKSEIPEFPWPPPKASATDVIPPEFFRKPSGGETFLRDVERKIHGALESCKYFDKSYYAVPDGFAMVTRLEQINSDGTSKKPPDRWMPEVQPLGLKFSLRDYLTRLFTASEGHFRIIVFVVTPHPFSQANVTISRDDAIGWLRGGGLNVLPDSIGGLRYTEKYSCTALIYEFVKIPDKEAEMKFEECLPGRVHLEKSKIWTFLEK